MSKCLNIRWHTLARAAAISWADTRGVSEHIRALDTTQEGSLSNQTFEGDLSCPPVHLHFLHLCTCPPPLPTITTNFQEPWRPSHHNLMNYAIFSFSKSHALGFRPGSICLYIQDARTERSGQEKIFYPRSVNQHFPLATFLSNFLDKHTGLHL